MLRFFSRGRKDPQDHPATRPSSAVRLHRAKLSAWAIAIGERRSTGDPPCRARRQHRGMLDDLPQPETPELAPLPTIRVLVDAIAGLFAFRPSRETSDGAVAGDPNPPVGEAAPVTYIDRSVEGESNAPAPAGRDRENARNRAA